ncbi:MAG TPA: hypothetical protein VMV10_10415 [Pirellulales bacterium]|nr:hypothetical protein [Pirellulales bacterium]
MDENPYKSPASERGKQSPAGGRRGLVETLCIATVWAFNAAIVGLIILVAGLGLTVLLSNVAAR